MHYFGTHVHIALLLVEVVEMHLQKDNAVFLVKNSRQLSLVIESHIEVFLDKSHQDLPDVFDILEMDVLAPFDGLVVIRGRLQQRRVQRQTGHFQE